MFCVCLNGKGPSTERHGGEEIKNTCTQKGRGRGWWERKAQGGVGVGGPVLSATFSSFQARALIILFHDQ